MAAQRNDSRKGGGKKGDEGVFCIFAYVLIWLSGIIVYVTEGQRSKIMKFHALQAIFLGVIIFILSFFPIIRIIGALLWLYGLYIGIKGYFNEDVEIPLLGEWARGYSK